MMELSTGWFIFWLWLVGSVGAIVGFGLCAILTMSKQADQAMDSMRCPKCDSIKETDWNLVA